MTISFPNFIAFLFAFSVWTGATTAPACCPPSSASGCAAFSSRSGSAPARGLVPGTECTAKIVPDRREVKCPNGNKTANVSSPSLHFRVVHAQPRLPLSLTGRRRRTRRRTSHMRTTPSRPPLPSSTLQLLEIYYKSKTRRARAHPGCRHCTRAPHAPDTDRGGSIWSPPSIPSTRSGRVVPYRTAERKRGGNLDDAWVGGYERRAGRRRRRGI